jgi:hypothetical protein
MDIANIVTPTTEPRYLGHAETMAKGLRELADFLEAYPESINGYDNVELVTMPSRSASEIARAGYGRMEKEPQGEYYRLHRKFSGKVELVFLFRRENACKRVKVGTKVIPATEDTVIPEKIIPAEFIPGSPEQIVDVYDWECPPLLGPKQVDELPATEPLMLPEADLLANADLIPSI